MASRNKKMCVTRTSLAAGQHPEPVLQAMRILTAEPRPSDATVDGMEELIRRRFALVDGISVMDVMMTYDVVDCTECLSEDEYDEEDLLIMDGGLDALFKHLSEAPSRNYLVGIFPGMYFASEGFPHVTLKVSIDGLRICNKREEHIHKARRHLMKYCIEGASYVVLEKHGANYTGRVFHPVEIFARSGEVRVGLRPVREQLIVEELVMEVAPRGKHVICGGGEDEDEDEDEDDC